MGAAEILTAYIAPKDYEKVAKTIYNKIQEEKPSMGSKIIKLEIDFVKIEADVSNDEEDFEHFQVDQLTLNTLYLTDKNGFALDCEEEIGDLIDEMLSEYNSKQIELTEREYQYS